MSELGKDSFGEGIAIQGPGLAKQYSIQEIEIRSIQRGGRCREKDEAGMVN